MIQQKPDRFAAWHDPRPYTEIMADKGYFEGMWQARRAESAQTTNVVNIKEAAHG